MSGFSAVFGYFFPLFAHFVPYKDLMYKGLFRVALLARLRGSAVVRMGVCGSGRVFARSSARYVVLWRTTQFVYPDRILLLVGLL